MVALMQYCAITPECCVCDHTVHDHTVHDVTTLQVQSSAAVRRCNAQLQHCCVYIYPLICVAISVA